MTTEGEQPLTEHAAKVEALLAEIEVLPDPRVREQVAGIVQGLLALYGAGLARIVECIGRSAERSPAGMLATLARDELVAHLLLLHDLHPLSLEARITQALEQLRPYLQDRGCGATLIGIQNGTAEVRLAGNLTCASSRASLNQAVRAAVLRAAPDLVSVVLLDQEPTSGQRVGPSAAFVPLTMLQRAGHSGEALEPGPAVGVAAGATHG